MDWWKPQDKNQTTKIRFIAKPNTYSSTHWVKGTGKSGCPICDELESEKTRRGNLFAFIKNIGAEDSAVGKAILKAFDEKIAILEPKVTKTVTTMRMPIPDSWSSMNITQKMQWCITNLDADALLTQMIKKSLIIYLHIILHEMVFHRVIYRSQVKLNSLLIVLYQTRKMVRIKLRHN